MTEVLGGQLAAAQVNPQTGSFIMLAHISPQVMVHSPKSKHAQLFQNLSPFFFLHIKIKSARTRRLEYFCF